MFQMEAFTLIDQLDSLPSSDSSPFAEPALVRLLILFLVSILRFCMNVVSSSTFSTWGSFSSPPKGIHLM
jgi:hypothetical protein